MLRIRGLVPDGRCRAPHNPTAGPPSWHSIARPCRRPQPRAAGRGIMRFLARAPDLASATWAVFFMWQSTSGQPRARLNAGALAHGALRRMAALDVALTTGNGGTDGFLRFLHAMRDRHARFFSTPIDFFGDLAGKTSRTSRNRTRNLCKKRRSLIDRAVFFGRFFRRSYASGVVRSNDHKSRTL